MKNHAQSAAGRAAPKNGVMDVNKALERLGQDEDLLRGIAQIYLEDAPALVEKIHAAVAAVDAKALHRASHNLKGLAANLSAQEVVDMAYRLEQMGATENLSEATEAVTEIDQRIGELNEAIQRYLRRK